MHITLLGDSTLDNGAYTGGGPAIPEQLKTLLGEAGEVTMLAVDGSTTEDVLDQLPLVPANSTHLLLSVGGNDAMLRVDVLNKPADSVADALSTLADVVAGFEADYRGCIAEVVSLGFPVSVCTIYNGAFDVESGEQLVVSTALKVFNDVICQAGFDAGLDVIDLRRVCDERSDFANPIEPNSKGGEKISRAIIKAAAFPHSETSRVVPSGER